MTQVNEQEETRSGAEGLADTIRIMALKRDAAKKLWLEPTEEMINAGIAEAQSQLEALSEQQNADGECDYHGYIEVENVTDTAASDLVVFILQAMANKLPKE